MKSITPADIPDECVRFDPALGIEAFNSFMMSPATPVVTGTQDGGESNERPVAPAAEQVAGVTSRPF